MKGILMAIQSSSTYELRIAGVAVASGGKKGVSTPGRLLSVDWTYATSGSRELAVTRETDAMLTPVLLGALGKGQRFASVAVDVINQGELQVTIELAEVTVQTYSATSQSDSPIDTESFTIAGSSMTLRDPRGGKTTAL
jgi:hypothetical protein